MKIHIDPGRFVAQHCYECACNSLVRALDPHTQAVEREADRRMVRMRLYAAKSLARRRQEGGNGG